MAELSEEEKYRRKQALLTRALGTADKLDAEDVKKEASEKLKAKRQRAEKTQARQADKEKERDQAKKDAEPVLS
jgi:hypothetical protein